ncbi:MAG: hypothetical protein GTN49_00545 [candidate division Zixibacteria bacterium]|nr:hypothetical protein [candidate division Zixibacteria bacterium]
MGQAPPELAKPAVEEVRCPPGGADSALETSARFIYHKLGFGMALQALARMLKKRSGVIYVAAPNKKLW